MARATHGWNVFVRARYLPEALHRGCAPIWLTRSRALLTSAAVATAAMLKPDCRRNWPMHRQATSAHCNGREMFLGNAQVPGVAHFSSQNPQRHDPVGGGIDQGQLVADQFLSMSLSLGGRVHALGQIIQRLGQTLRNGVKVGSGLPRAALFWARAGWARHAICQTWRQRKEVRLNMENTVQK